MELDHLILSVNDRAASIRFYERILGVAYDGDDGPFARLRVAPGFVILLSESATDGGEHLAFALSEDEFHAALARIREDGVPYGDAFDTVGSMRGPAEETGARGLGQALYFFDPDRHLLEIRYYEDSRAPRRD